MHNRPMRSPLAAAVSPPPPQAIWLLLFLMLDRGDEYQLVNFVVGFKVCTPRATSLHPGRWSTSRPLPRPVCAWRGARSHGQDPSVRACGEHVEIYWHVKDARGRFSWSCVADTSREVSMRAQHNACAHEYFRVGAQRSALWSTHFFGQLWPTPTSRFPARVTVAMPCTPHTSRAVYRIRLAFTSAISLPISIAVPFCTLPAVSDTRRASNRFFDTEQSTLTTWTRNEVQRR